VAAAAVEPLASEATSNSPPKADEKETFRALAKLSCDVEKCNALMSLLWRRCDDSQGRNWKHGHKAMRLLFFLLSAGSEPCLASAWDNLSRIHKLSFFRTDAVGVSYRA
jgi:hypothetical protein